MKLAIRVPKIQSLSTYKMNYTEHIDVDELPDKLNLKMKASEVKLFIVFLVLAYILIPCHSGVFQRVHVTVINGLGHGRNMDIQCRSKDDDLGRITVPDGQSISWSFRVNLWGTTLFSCEVVWVDSVAKGFAAYSHKRDGRRCHSECIWLIGDDGLLYGRDPDSGKWEFVPYQN